LWAKKTGNAGKGVLETKPSKHEIWTLGERGHARTGQEKVRVVSHGEPPLKIAEKHLGEKKTLRRGARGKVANGRE